MQAMNHGRVLRKMARTGRREREREREREI
jgi:hypothetical protein